MAPAAVAHGGSGGTTLVDREKVSRKYRKVVVDDFREPVLDEVRTALANGWAITYAQCGPTDPRPLPKPDMGRDSGSMVAFVDLQKSAGDLGQKAFAELTAYAYKQQQNGTGPNEVGVRIVAYPPYHSDKGWPQLPPVAYGDTCLANPAASAIGTWSTPAFPDGLSVGLSRSQPLNEKGEPDGSAR
ncbi:hypothetical protein [Mycobacteroides saopaulense]|uniref:hypothetical protein n=1 Tax=Mycobacteroides saopaulense TaxID=1578165 RepID=UPI001041E6EF|nr:hypothetical protein [Mycobacteroides saopaulense]